MTRFRHIFLVTVVSLGVIVALGCSADPRLTKIPPDLENWESDGQFQSAIEQLSDDEKGLVLAYLMRVKLGEAFGGSGIKEGLTIGEAFGLQKQWMDEQKQRADEQEREQDRRKKLASELEGKRLEALHKMNHALTVTLLSLQFEESDLESGVFLSRFIIKIGFKNNTAKDLAGVKGTVVLNDIFGDTIKEVNLSSDDGIAANADYVYTGTINYNQFMARDKKLRTTAFDKLQFDWEPEVYMFTDGSKLTMPEPHSGGGLASRWYE